MDRQSEISEQTIELRGLNPQKLNDYLTRITTAALEDLDLDSEKDIVNRALKEITLKSEKPATIKKIDDRDRLFDTDPDSNQRFPNPESRRSIAGEYPGFHISQPRPDGKVLQIYIYGGLRDNEANLHDNLSVRQKGNDSASQTDRVLSQATNFRFEVTDERGNQPTSHIWLETQFVGNSASVFKMAETGNYVLNRDILIPPHISKQLIEQTHIATAMKQSLNQRPS